MHTLSSSLLLLSPHFEAPAQIPHFFFLGGTEINYDSHMTTATVEAELLLRDAAAAAALCCRRFFAPLPPSRARTGVVLTD